MKRLNLAWAICALALAATHASAAGYVGLTQADGVTPISPTSPLYVGGGVASGATDAGGPVKIGCIITNSSFPTFVAGQRGDVQCNIKGFPYAQIGDRSGNSFDGRSATVDGLANQLGLAVSASLIGYNGTTSDAVRGNTTGLAILNGGIPAQHWNFASAASGIVNTTTAVTIKTAGGAGVRNCISNLQVDHATLGAATELAIRDGAAGTVLWRTQLQTTATQGVDYNLGTAVCGTANTLTEVVTLTAVTGGVYVNAQGYVSP